MILLHPHTNMHTHTCAHTHTISHTYTHTPTRMETCSLIWRQARIGAYTHIGTQPNTIFWKRAPTELTSQQKKQLLRSTLLSSSSLPPNMRLVLLSADTNHRYESQIGMAIKKIRGVSSTSASFSFSSSSSSSSSPSPSAPSSSQSAP